MLHGECIKGSYANGRYELSTQSRNVEYAKEKAKESLPKKSVTVEPYGYENGTLKTTTYKTKHGNKYEKQEIDYNPNESGDEWTNRYLSSKSGRGINLHTDNDSYKLGVDPSGSGGWYAVAGGKKIVPAVTKKAKEVARDIKDAKKEATKEDAVYCIL